MNTPIRFFGIGMALAVLAGCSGSGGSDPSIAAPVSMANITSQNAPVIAGTVLDSALDGGGLGSFAALGPLGLPVGSETELFATITEVQHNQTEFLKSTALNGMTRAAIPEQMTMCPGGGMMTLSGTIQNALTLSPNDTVTLVFDMCSDGVGGMTDGTFAMQITDFQGDLASGMFLFGVAVTLTDFQVTANDVTATANGSMSMTIDTQLTSTTAVTVTASGLTVGGDGATHTLSNFSVSQSIDDATGAYIYDLSGTLSSSRFEGQVTFSTSVLLQGIGVDYASVGELVITGADGAYIQVIVLDGVLVRLEIHLDSDGVADEVVDTTWDALTNSPDGV